MTYSIVYKPYAERDIWEISDSLSDYSVSAAQEFLAKLRKKIAALSEMPHRFQKISSGQEYRKMVVDKYVVIFLVDEHANQVFIMRVVHGMRNYQNNVDDFA